MKENHFTRLRYGVGLALLLAAAGIILWQGIGGMDSSSTSVQKIVEITSTTSTVTTVFSAATTSTGRQTTTVSTQATEKVTTEEAVTESVQFPLELNQATAAELTQISGIGEVLSERIVAYRSQIGGFSNLEQLKEVQGIGDGIYSKIVGFLYLESETYPVSEAEVVESAEPAENSVEIAEPESVPAAGFPLDLNLATKEELLQLPEMTDSVAEEILQFRAENQYYSSVYELLYLDGVSDKYFQQIREFVQVDPENIP
jgi:competence ComEA-like helix-hairpin-helix protein